MIEIWEMSVERSQKDIPSVKTDYDNGFLCFPCKRLRALYLFEAKNVQFFLNGTW